MRFFHNGLSFAALFVYAGTLGQDGAYTKTGYPLKNVKGRVRQLGLQDSGNDITLVFPKGKTLYDVDWLGVISRKKKALYSRVLVDEVVKEQVPRPLTLPEILLGLFLSVIPKCGTNHEVYLFRVKSRALGTASLFAQTSPRPNSEKACRATRTFLEKVLHAGR